MSQISFRKAALWLGIAILVCYVWSVFGTFHFDDSHSVESNLAVRSLANIPSFWTDTRTSSFIPENRVYRPLVYTFYSFCWLLGQGSTVPFHLMKMLMHWWVCLNIFLIWSRLWAEPGWFPLSQKQGGLKVRFPLVSKVFSITPSWAAFFLALVFAIHPTGSECVDYISATTSLQCAMFYLWAYYAYLCYRDSVQEGRGNWKLLAGSLFLYFLSVASKEEGITLPAMILVTELFLLPGKARFWPAVRRMLPYALLGVVLGTWIFLMHPESGNESRGYATWDTYFMTQWRAYLWYMRLWFWPWDLNADYATMEFSKSITDPLVIQAMIGNGLLITFGWCMRKRFPAMLFGLLWFYITISPASSVIRLAEAINEHRMYLAYVGFVGGTFTILLSCAENFFAPERRAQRLGWIYALILVGLFIGTQSRNRVWADDESLWTDTVEKNPTSGRAFNNLALVYLSKGDFQKAVDYLERCEKYWTTYMYCPLNQGVALQALGADAESHGRKGEAATLYDRAEAAYHRAYDLNPRSVHSNFHLAKFYEEVRKDYGRALDLYRVSVEVTGGRYPAAEARMGNCYLTLKRPGEAIAVLDHALEVEPTNEIVLFEKARAQYDSHDLRGAAATYSALVQVNPRHVQGWYNMGVALLEQGDLSHAREAFERTLSLDPASEQALFNLSFVAERQGDGRMAVQSMQRLVELAPAQLDFKTRLGQLRKRFGETL